ncbi:axin interactor, dorsalization-associated protein B-like [Liolophura sinensis]|uniref:axin interactor, dorsalization-associated protein B-like n=1 Tax=Liolophura sinensis TaxID=3198878 RepID=UPI003158204D
MEADRDELISEWSKAFKKGTDYDLWGQPVEAVDSYRRLSEAINSQTCEEDTNFSDEQKRILGKIVTCLDLRIGHLKKPGNHQGISLDDLNKIGQTFDKLLTMKCKDFPIDVSAAQIWAHTMNSIAMVHNQTESYDAGSQEEEQHRIKAKGSLLPKPLPIGGKQVLTVFISKLGLKDASQYLDPYITVSVKNKQGIDLTAQQDTPISGRKEDQYVIFNVPVHIQKPIDILPPDYAVYFEFKHYKPGKKTLSTKCWSFMERDEIKDGEAVIELYKKPADFRRKSLNLLTVKPLYLHLKLSISM